MKDDSCRAVCFLYLEESHQSLCIGLFNHDLCFSLLQVQPCHRNGGHHKCAEQLEEVPGEECQVKILLLHIYYVKIQFAMSY